MLEPFLEYGFLRNGLLACIFLSIGSAPLGVVLMLRKLSLMGEALAHGILPGIAIAYLIGGLWLPGLSIGGAIAGILICIMANFATNKTILHDDASFSGFYIVSLAVGFLLLSLNGGNTHVFQILFGNILAIDNNALLVIFLTSLLSIVVFLLFYKEIIYQAFDPIFVQQQKKHPEIYSAIFLLLFVLNLVVASSALGTMMALGLMLLPAIIIRLWFHTLQKIMIYSMLLSISCSYIGLVISYHFDLPSAPTLICLLGVCYVLSLTFAPKPSV